MAKINGYPDSVQAGAPKLYNLPDGWEQSSLSRHLSEVRRPAVLEDNTLYTLVTVKRGRGGVVEREKLFGKKVKVKTQFYIREGDFLISKRQIVHGACGIVPAELDGAVVSNEYAVLQSNGNFFLPFLKYLSESIYFQQTCFHSSIGVHIEKMLFKLDRWLDWQFHIPEKSEQERIYAVLSTWDRAIETTARLIENRQNQKRGLSDRLLTGEKRFKRFATLKWDHIELNQLCEIRRGASPRPISNKKWFAPTGRGWVRISDVTSSTSEYLSEATQYLSPAGVDASVAVEPGELIMSICATIGVPKIVGIPVCIHDGFVVFRNVKETLSIAFLYHYLEFMADRLSNSGQPGTQKNLNTTIVGNLKVPNISLEEQETIATCLSTADAELRALRDQLRALKRERAALMQQLLTGKRRVRATELAA